MNVIFADTACLDRAKKEGKRILLYGAGISGRIVYRILKTVGISADIFVDNSCSKIGTYIINDVLCVKPTEIEDKDNCIVYICVAWEKTDALYKQAYDDGFRIFCHIRGILDEVLR